MNSANSIQYGELGIINISHNKQALRHYSLETIRILHIEDDVLDAQIFHDLLNRLTALNTTVHHVKRLAEAVTAIKSGDYDLIVSDLMLPDSEGLQTLESIHQLTTNIPIIALTGSQDDEISAQAIHCGAEDYLVKGETDARLLGRVIRYAIDRKQAQLKLETLAQIDALTGLLNRHAFEEQLQQTMLRTERNQQVTALLFIDLDFFKCVNDQYGHQAGDALLQATAGRLTNSIRQQDNVARMGGDEFVVILEDVQSEKMAKTIAYKMLASLQQPILFEGKEISITASIGIYLYNGKNVITADELLSRADSAMYLAKHEGRNTINCYQPHMEQQHANTKESQQHFDLRQALSNNEFFLEYQPQIDVRTGQLVGAEALLRWQHPKRGVIAPDEFIETLENSGQIISVGAWVLETACAQWSRWIDSGKIPADRKISVNLSPRQCQQSDFAERLQAILDTTGLSPYLLDLELTEGMLLENSESNTQLMCNLKKMGVNLTLDDFGTGFSSLCYLTQFPVDRLKVDKSFVSNILHSRSAEAIAIAIIGLANNLGLEVVAEGVDQQEKIDLLNTHGCDIFQGFHLSMPMTANDFAQHCHQNHLQ